MKLSVHRPIGHRPMGRTLVLLMVSGLLAAGALTVTPTPTPSPASAIELCPPEDEPCPPPNPTGPEPAPGPSAPPGTLDASLSWSMAPRFGAVWESFTPSGGGYDHDLVDPDTWSVELDACASSAAVSYAFEAPDATDVSASGCRATATFPAEGTYDVAVTVWAASGADDTATARVVVDDLFIVALGDSAASGEGNPDVQAQGPAGSVAWQHEQCHRSARSGMAKAAHDLESRQRSVTFVSLACSGAEIDEGLLEHDQGIEPGAGPELPAQLDALHDLLCRGDRDPCDPEPRPVDAVWLSIGINDLSFSKIIRECANPFKNNCNTGRGAPGLASSGLTEIRGRAIDVDASLTGPLAEADVYLTEYPDDPFDSAEGGSGCGAFDLGIGDAFWPDLPLGPLGPLGGQGVNEDEAAWLHETGIQLNGLLRELAIRYGWTYVDGISEDFAGHGYCASTPWFRGFSESLWIQRDYFGAMHPNAAGHRAIADHLLDAFLATRPPPPPDRSVSVVLEAFKVTDTARVESEEGVEEGERRLALSSVMTNFEQGVAIESTVANAPSTGTMVVPLNQWVTLSPQPTLRLTATNRQSVGVSASVVLPKEDLGNCIPQDEDCSPRPARRLTAGVSHRVADGNPGADRVIAVNGPSSRLEVRYHLTVGPLQLGEGSPIDDDELEDSDVVDEPPPPGQPGQEPSGPVIHPQLPASRVRPAARAQR